MSTNRVEVVERNLDSYLESARPAAKKLAPDEPLRSGSGLTARKAVELFEDMVLSRALDVGSRELKKTNQSFYTISSAGHELNALLGAQLRLTDPCFLHYRSGGLMIARARQLPGSTPLFDAVGLGVDQFDCVMQTRIGRHGTALTGEGKLHIKNAKHTVSDEPLDSACSCDVCQRHSRGYIRHLFQVGEPTAARLVSLHNISWTLQLMAGMRAAIEAGTFGAYRQQVLAVWG